jgi:hypothetical protein
MNTYEGIVIVTFVIIMIIIIRQFIESESPRVCDVLQIMNILPGYEIKAFKNGKRLKN